MWIAISLCRRSGGHLGNASLARRRQHDRVAYPTVLLKSMSTLLNEIIGFDASVAQRLSNVVCCLL